MPDPSPPTPGAGDRWLAGHHLPGVHFAHHQTVSVTAGPHAGRTGRIALLLALGDDPLYLVLLLSDGAGTTGEGTTGEGRGARIRQSALAGA